jgi:hypothetical protein
MGVGFHRTDADYKIVCEKIVRPYQGHSALAATGTMAPQWPIANTLISYGTFAQVLRLSLGPTRRYCSQKGRFDHGKSTNTLDFGRTSWRHRRPLDDGLYTLDHG